MIKVNDEEYCDDDDDMYDEDDVDDDYIIEDDYCVNILTMITIMMIMIMMITMDKNKDIHDDDNVLFIVTNINHLHHNHYIGIEVRFADPLDPSNFEKLIDDKTRLIYGETLPNPYLRVFPIQEVADIGKYHHHRYYHHHYNQNHYYHHHYYHRHHYYYYHHHNRHHHPHLHYHHHHHIGKKYGIPLIIDNTASPILCKPIQHGASIVIHSLTKFIGGHGNSIGGIIIDSGNFDWKFNNGLQQPNLNQPDLSYGGVIWSDAVPVLTGANIPFIIRARVVLLRDLGIFLTIK